MLNLQKAMAKYVVAGQVSRWYSYKTMVEFTPEVLGAAVERAQRAAREGRALDAIGADAGMWELHSGYAVAGGRHCGGFVTRLALESVQAGDVVEVLYTPPDAQDIKLSAWHPMMPVGPSDGLGGQHGYLRWVRHEPGEITQNHLSAAIELTPHRSDAQPELTRVMLLQPDSFTATTLALSRSMSSGGTSWGEHIYFALPEGTPADIRIGGERLDTLLRPGAAQGVAAGDAQFWPDFPGDAVVTFPDKEILLQATYTEAGGYTTVQGFGMLIWQRPGQPSICLEPVRGYSPETGNSGLALPAGRLASMATTIQML